MDISKIEILNTIKSKILTGTAVYISDDFIDVAKADLTQKGMEVSYLQRFPILENIKGLSLKEAKDQIDKILDKAGLLEKDKPYRVAVNLKNDYFLLRRFTFKEIPRTELKKVLIFEAQKYVPYAMDDLIFTFKKCTKKEKVLEIIFAASEAKHVNELIKYFGEKNIIPSIIEPSPVLIARGLGLEGKLKKDKAYLSVHYEPTHKVIITGIWRGFPYFFREIKIFPGEDGFKTSELTYPPLKGIWSIIANDVLGAAEYLKKETQQNIEKVFISGFPSSPDEKTISDDFGAPFTRPDLSYFKGAEAEKRDRFLPTLSLLYETLHSPSLNLAPEEITYKDLWTFKPVAEKALWFLCGILALHLIFSGTNFIQQRKIRSVERDFNIYKVISKDASREEVLRHKDIAKDRAEFINRLVSGRIYLTEKLNRLGRDITESAWIDAVTFRNSITEKVDTFLRINGAIYVFAEEGVVEINDILERLKSDQKMMNGFKDIELVSVKKNKFLDKEITEFVFVLK